MNRKRKIFATIMALEMVLTSLTLLAPPVLAAPNMNPIVIDSADGIATIYEDGGNGGVGLQANHTSWIIGRDLTAYAPGYFNVAQCPEEMLDSGQHFTGYDWFSYGAGGHWALGDGWAPGDNSMNLARLESGLT